LFQSDNVDPAAIQEASRLAKSAAGIWFGGWVGSFLLASFYGGSGEMAMLGAFVALGFLLVIVTISSVISLRLAVRAIRLDSDSVLAKVTFGLNCTSLLFVVVVGGLILSDFAR
jgi:hypothetical protein